MTQQLSTSTPAKFSIANGSAPKAYMVGGGIGSLAAAAFLRRSPAARSQKLQEPRLCQPICGNP